MLWNLILVTDLGGLGLGAWLLWGRARGNRDQRTSDARTLAALGVALGAFALLSGAWMRSGFLVARLLCHALFCVLAPLAIARGVQRRGAFGSVLIALGLAGEGAYVWAREVEPFRLQVTHHEVTSARLAGAQPLRVLVLADLQTDALGAYEERVFARIDAERPDLVLVPGDLLQLSMSPPESAQRERDGLTALFAGLQHRPRLGFLMAGGDCEPPGVGLPEAGLRLLEDEAVVFPAEHLQVIGLTRARSRQPIEATLAAAARAFDGLTIVMGHAPEFALSAADVGVPLLCVAGHTHGGQVVLPFFGPLVTLSSVPRAMAAGGLFALGESWLCVSRGVGMERGDAPRIRFLCPPELVVLELGAAAPSPRDAIAAGSNGEHPLDPH